MAGGDPVAGVEAGAGVVAEVKARAEAGAEEEVEVMARARL